MSVKKLSTLVVISILGILVAEQSIMNIGKIDKQKNLPINWNMNTNSSFLPSPKVSYTIENEKNVMTIMDITAENGFRFDCYKKYPVVKGDEIILIADVKGKGEATFTVQAFSNQKWTGHIGIKHFKLTDKWEEVKIPFSIVDLSEKDPTTSVICHWGAKKGAKISIRSLKLEIIKK